MRGRNSSKYYRRNTYKKRKLRNILIISAICLVVLFLLFVLFGNLLNNKLELERVSKDNAQTPAVPIGNTVSYTIEAYPVNLNPDTDFSERMYELSKRGIRSASLNLSDPQGQLLIHSDIAASLGYQNKDDSLVDLSSVISKAKYYNIFSSAIFELQFLSENDAKHRAVVLAYESALAAEIIEMGANEVIVRATGADATNTNLLIDFADSVKSINDSVVLGVALPVEFFFTESAAENISKLAESFDILGIDVSDIPNDDKDTLEYIESTFAASDLKYYVLRYNMRVLLPQISDEQDEEMRAVLADNSIQNWQKIS